MTELVLLMADVPRLVDRFDGLADHPACHACVARATGPPGPTRALVGFMRTFTFGFS